jgi:hypothetical protein
MKQNPNSALQCPHCHAEQDGLAGDFVIPNKLGKESRATDLCIECDERFKCETLPDGSIQVQKV